VARPFISRMLETFFRRKWLYLLPLVPFIALGVLTVLSTGDSWRSTGVVRVNLNTVLDQVNPDAGNPLSGETAATYTARQINNQLGTEDFLHSVMIAAGIEPDGGSVDDAVRRSVGAAAVADDLVTVSASTSDPTRSVDLAEATIATFIQSQIDEVREDSGSATTYLEEQLTPLKEEYDRAQSELRLYSQGLSGPATEQPPNVQTELGRLSDEVTRTGDAYNTALGRIGEAEQAGNESAAKIPQQYRTIDAPEQPLAPEPRRKQDIMTLAIFTILGLLVSGAALVVGTLMDRSVRFSDEIEAHLDVPVIATIPDSAAAVMPRIL
jgi:uncharacterized protein involved in exopolysaccharide biosynthesis